MQMRRLGASLAVSPIGLGCMGMTGSYGPVDLTEAEATLAEAVDLGVTMFDTADGYGGGRNEELVGRVLAPHRDRLVLATKFGVVVRADGTRGFSGHPDHVKAACEASLKRLGTDRIDLYYQHRVDPDVPIEDTVGAMADLVAAGKVLHLGLSEAGPATIRRAHAVYPIAALQTEYSLWSRDIEETILPVLRELGIGLVPYSPLGRGFLTGKIAAGDVLAEGDSRRNYPRFAPENVAANQQLVGLVDGLARAHACTPANIALAWLLARGSDIVPIPGTRRRSYLCDNLAALRVQLPAADLRLLSEAFAGDAVAGARYPEHLLKAIDR